MVRIEEHISKIKEIKQQINNSEGNRKKQLIKCLHRLNKQLKECEFYLKG